MRSFITAIRAVLSAFIGIRKRGSAEVDQQLKPIHIVVAALICVGLLIAGLITLVSFLVR